MRPSVFRLIALCGVAAGASLALAGPAGAVPPPTVPLQFHYGVLDTPALGPVPVITPAGQPLKVNAVVTSLSATGLTFTVPADKGHFNFPTYSFTKPAPGTISVTLKSPATGTVTFSSGQVTMTADLVSDISLTGLGDCSVDTGSLNMSTATKEPLLGQAFPAGSSGVATGNGAFGAAWSTLSGTGTACPFVNADLKGVGGLWISTNLAPPTLGIAIAKPHAVKAGKTRKIKVTFKNAGGVSTGSVKACLKAPKGFKKPLKVCKTVTNVPAGKSVTVTYKVKPIKMKTKRYSLKLTAMPAATGLRKAQSTQDPSGALIKSVTLKVLK